MRSITLLVLLAIANLIGSTFAVSCSYSTSSLCQAADTQSACLAALQETSSCIFKNCTSLKDYTKQADCYAITCKSSNEEVAKVYTDYANCLRPTNTSFSATTSALVIQTISAVVIAIIATLLA